MPLALLVFSLPVLAAPGTASYKASSSTSAGQGNFSEGLSLSGDHPTSDADDSGAVDWNAGYTYSKAPVGNDFNKTSDINLNVGFKKDWDFGGGFDYSSTPAESLSSVGPEGWVGYEFLLGGGAKDSFRPSIEPKFTYHGQTYTQTFSGTTTRVGVRRTVTRPTTGSQAIRQNEYTLGIDLSPVELFSVHVAGSSYKYNKDVSSFIALLDSPRAVSRGASTFSTTLGGFPKSSAELGLSLFPWETWTFTLDFTRTKVQADGSTSTSSKIEVEKELSKAVKLGLGFDHEKSETQGEENLTILDLAYSF